MERVWAQEFAPSNNNDDGAVNISDMYTIIYIMQIIYCLNKDLRVCFLVFNLN